MKFRRIKQRVLSGRKVNSVFKAFPGTEEEMKKLRKPKLKLSDGDECCSERLRDLPKDKRFMVMGKKRGNDLVATFILPWTKSSVSLSR